MLESLAVHIVTLLILMLLLNVFGMVIFGVWILRKVENLKEKVEKALEKR